MRARFPFLMSAVALLPRPAAAQVRPDSGAFVVTIGRDTIAVERYLRTRNHIAGVVINREPRTVSQTYAVDMAPDGMTRTMEITYRNPLAPPDSAPLRRVVLTFAGDTATRRIGSDILKIKMGPGGMPWQQLFYPLYENIARRALNQSAAKVTYNTLVGREIWPLTVERVGRDSMTMTNVDGPIRMRIDRNGRILGVDATSSTDKWLVQRLPWLDTDAFGRAFAARDMQGQQLGQLSPRDTLRATIGGANLMIDYGRPSKRGRVIFGGKPVPWGEVWRTGANEATQFKTDRDLVIGGVLVPAGMYTLFTLPTQQGWKLIINKQTGQWGTDYEAQQDLARLDLTTSQLTDPVERFTFMVEPSAASGGVLKYVWDTTEARVLFTIK
jgi:hypothetical protein